MLFVLTTPSSFDLARGIFQGVKQLSLAREDPDGRMVNFCGNVARLHKLYQLPPVVPNYVVWSLWRSLVNRATASSDTASDVSVGHD